MSDKPSKPTISGNFPTPNDDSFIIIQKQPKTSIKLI